jgi:hypothetical protein
VTHSIVQAPLQSESLLYISRLVKTRRPHSGLLQSLSCLLHFLGCFFQLLIFSLGFVSSHRLISPLLFIYYLSILVEVLLRLLTYRVDLVLLYLVSEDRS